MKTFTDKDINKLLINELTILKFSASWCGPCKKIAPHIEQLSVEYPYVNFYSVDADDNECSELVNMYNISALPTFVFVRNNELLDTVCGANLDEVKLTLNRYV